MSEHIRVTTVERVLQVQMHRPEKKNALTRAMYAALDQSLHQAEADDAIRVVLLTGTEGCFTSGNDLFDFMNEPPTGPESPVMQFLFTLSRFPKPLVAAVDGVAIGIGTTLLLHCDLVYAASRARFKLPFVNLGLVPEAGSSLLLPQMVGYHRAAELLLTGEMFDAEAAQQMGFVNACHPSEALLEAAQARAQQIAALPPSAIRQTKAFLKQSQAEAVQDRIREESLLFAQRLQSPEALEAFQAFMERRAPDFSSFS